MLAINFFLVNLTTPTPQEGSMVLNPFYSFTTLGLILFLVWFLLLGLLVVTKIINVYAGPSVFFSIFKD